MQASDGEGSCSWSRYSNDTWLNGVLALSSASPNCRSDLAFPQNVALRCDVGRVLVEEAMTF